MYNFFGICILCKSLVLCGVVPRLYMHVSRAEVTMSIPSCVAVDISDGMQW